MKLGYRNLHVLDVTPFAIAPGIEGRREVITAMMAGKDLRQVFCVFPAPSSRKIIVTASALARYDVATDKSMKTFKLRQLESRKRAT